jgi:hypothetical protein
MLLCHLLWIWSLLLLLSIMIFHDAVEFLP